MRNVLTAVVLLAALVAGVVLLSSGGEEPPRYKVVLDNAFGLTEDADLKAAGVRVGKVDTLEVQSRTARALVTVVVEREEFAGFRNDVFCRVEPQSLIGEYFLNCDPGTGARALPEGATIPVERTAGTVPPDLITDIMRRPYRERFGLILAELGLGFAARGTDVNRAIERAVPALRETDRVLKILASERRTLQALTRDADVVLGRLAGGRRDLSRFVAEARDTAAASADRSTELAETVRRAPGFLRELRPALADLGTAARRQTPALADLRAAAGDTEQLFDRLGPFAEAARPALVTLGDAASRGRRAVRPARATIRELRTVARRGRDPVRNLRFVLEHIGDRKFAIERNPLSPGGEGFTGMEAFLQYPFTQAQAINIFDSKGYTLKINALINECTRYTDAAGALRDPERTKRCSAALGPGSPPLEPLPSGASGDSADPGSRSPERSPESTRPAAPSTPSPGPAAPAGPPSLLPEELKLPGLPPIRLPPVELPPPLRGSDPRSAGDLLDFLLGP